MNAAENTAAGATAQRHERAIAHMIQGNETEFEKARGVSRIEVRHGYAQAHVSQLPEPLQRSRLAILERITDAGVSIDFLKLTQSGLSFMVPEVAAEQTEACLRGSPHASVRTGRSLVLVHAVNIRDEEGLMASIVSTAIESGASIEHLSEMHDRVLIGTTSEDSDRLATALKTRFHGGQP